MTATRDVPMYPPSLVPSYQVIGSGKPVRSGTWMSAAQFANWLIGRGVCLISGTAATALNGVGTYVFTYWVYGDQWHTTRVWAITLGRSVIVADGTGDQSGVAFGTVQISGIGNFTHRFSVVGDPETFYWIDDYTSGTVRPADPTGGAGEQVTVSITLGNGSHACDVLGVQMWEAPKELLDTEGVIVSSEFTNAAIFDGSTVQRSVGAISKALLFARRMVRRGSLFTWSSANIPLFTQSLAFVDFFSVYPALQARKTAITDVTRTINVRVFARMNSVGPTGNVKFTMTNGSTVTLVVTGTATAWYSGTIQVNVDDATQVARIAGGVRDLCRVEWKTTVNSVAGQLQMFSICISDIPGI